MVANLGPSPAAERTSDRLSQVATLQPSAAKQRSAIMAGGPLASAFALAACGGEGGDAQPAASPSVTPTAQSAPTAWPSVDPNQIKAARFLAQASVGCASGDIEALAGTSVEAWLDTQLAMPRPQKFWDFLVTNGYDASSNKSTTNGFDPMIWSQLIGSGDVLRQRVGLALLNIWVVSIDGITSSWKQFNIASYLDNIWDNAFGNYRDVMEAASTSLAMGMYLTYLGSTKQNNTKNEMPDENFARELMQLFTIGLYHLEMDGTESRSGGEPIPTYTQEDVSLGARVWTGYTYGSSEVDTPARVRLPMAIRPSLHETQQTSFLGGRVNVPSDSDAQVARKITLDGLFNHPNMPPFICKRLIQSLVSSNPSPAYIRRVAMTFVDNGNGVRGDLKAVIRAILLDAEARDDTVVASTSFGKLREPVLRFLQWARAFKVRSPSQLWPFGSLASGATQLGQSPARAPSVFNWFRPGYSPAGTAISNAGLVAPEFQIANEPSVIGYVNFMQSVVESGAGDAQPDYSEFRQIASDSSKLVSKLNLVLAANQINEASLRRIRDAVESINGTTDAGLTRRVQAATVLILASPEYLIVR
ncbi:DUF1800 domain-containing protein [Novosphingobium sp. ERN07]|uniref:DUF1800 domain-containing protein n=1 Tax=Novosphingobium sp. ERN07 TaxID=2726187 RepID=UPI001456C723|nr:DUF1800 family protein [Novosphingobium sp. ERN07]NLR73396.1 DUF1800 domain-containing protein [Novosphingobium sp. ERN07]